MESVSYEHEKSYPYGYDGEPRGNVFAISEPYELIKLLGAYGNYLSECAVYHGERRTRANDASYKYKEYSKLSRQVNEHILGCHGFEATQAHASDPSMQDLLSHFKARSGVAQRAFISPDRAMCHSKMSEVQTSQKSQTDDPTVGQHDDSSTSASAGGNDLIEEPPAQDHQGK